jgi:glycosyltransferase involved in cell wall biosynthesis
VVYTGTFYGHRSPDVFLEAVRRLLRGNRVPVRDLEVVFVGHTARATGLEVARDTVVRVVEQRPYFEALRYLDQAAVLLLVVPREGGAGNHTGKLFNYLASGRPILALAPEPNVAADLIRESRSGVVAPPDDPDAVARSLLDLYGRWRSGTLLPDQDRAVIARYEARPQAQAYAALLDDLLAARRPVPR